LGQLGLVAGSLHLLAAQAVGLLGPADQLVLDRERHLQCQWGHRVDQQVPDGPVDIGPTTR
jgi:uncharacterized protein YcaQ